jgi:putative tricarboxylic transport membrane protein
MSGSSPNPASPEDVDAGAELKHAVEDDGTVDRRIDLAVCAAFFLFGLAIFVLSGDIRQGSIHDPIGPDGWPKLLGAVLMLAMGANILRRLASWRSDGSNMVLSDGDKDDMPGEPGSFLRALAMLAGGFGWVFAVKWTGFIVATAAVFALGMALMKVRTPGKLVVLPLLLSLGIWLLFGVLFGIRLPAGPIEHALLDLVEALK